MNNLLQSRYFLIASLSAVISLASCDKSKDKDSPTKDQSASQSNNNSKSQKTPDSASSLLSKDRVKTKEICSEVFSLELAQKATGFDLSGHDFLAHGRGRCGIGSGKTAYRLSFSIMRVEKKAENVGFYFDNMTKNKNSDDLKKDMAKIAEVAEKMEPGVTTKAKPVTKHLSNMPTLTYSDVAGIGDRARMQTSVYKGNTTYSMVVAFRGVIFSTVLDGKSLDEAATQKANEKLAKAVANALKSL